MSTLGISEFPLSSSERVVTCNSSLLSERHLLLGITRVRNEALILQDTLDYVGNFVDVIIAYDDASTDQTLAILKNHEKVALVIENDIWREGSDARLKAETNHRSQLLEIAKAKINTEWIYCFDADERVIGDVRDFLANVSPDLCDGVRVRLFDAYLTADDHAPFASGQELLNFRSQFGPERRDILMFWRNKPAVRFEGLDAREPSHVENILIHFDCQHYGKALSVAQWEETCDYYAQHFPYQTYGQKWLRRKGQAIHCISDFAQPLHTWGAELFNNAVNMDKAALACEGAQRVTIPGQLSVLMATNHLFGWTGSETLLLTLLEGLHSSDCSLTVYARYLNKEWAATLLHPDIRIVDELDELRGMQFDVAHVQHSTCLVDIRSAFPRLPIIYSSLGPSAFLEQPPPFDCGIERYLAISEEVRDKLISQGVPHEAIEIVRNIVSENRFQPSRPIKQRPENILVISNKINDAPRVMLQMAARQIGASIRFAGGTPEVLTQEQLASAINAADIVVSIGRGVIEAMLSGRVPLVFDIHGCDGLVTPENMDTLGACNFSGRHESRQGTISRLVQEMTRYRQEMGQELRERATKQFGLKHNLPRLLNIYAEVALTKPLLSQEKQQTIMYASRLGTEDLRMSKHYRRVTEDLQKELLRVRKTVSWRITGPARAAWNILLSAFRPKDSK